MTIIHTGQLKREAAERKEESDASFNEWIRSLGYCDGRHTFVEGPRYMGHRSCKVCGKLKRRGS